MYGRNINFTLLAPSLWAVVEAIASNIEEEKYKIAIKNNLAKISEFKIHEINSIANEPPPTIIILSLFLSNT